MAVALLAIFASSLSAYLTNQLAYMTRGQSALEAIYLAQEGLEAARSIRDVDWDNLATGTHGLVYDGTWDFSGTEEIIGKFTRVISVAEIAENERNVISLVTWPGTASLRSVSLATNLSNWREIVEPLLIGNWGNPKTLGSINLGPGSTPTGLVVRNGIVYMSSIASSGAKSDFFVIDATDGMYPFIAGELETGPGLNDVAIANGFAFLANMDSTNHLLIANISNPVAPYLIKSYRLTGNTEQALTVAATGTAVIMGTASNSGSEIYVVNVENPTSPAILAEFEVGANVNNMFIKGDKVYIATSHDNQEVIILDIANPGNPAIIATINLPSTNDAIGIFVNYQDNRLYAARKTSAVANSPEAVIYSVKDPANPQFLGSLEFGNDIYSAYGADNLMFIATSYSSQEFQLFNAVNPANLQYWIGLNFPQNAVDMVLEDNVVYVAVRSNDALRIITSE